MAHRGRLNVLANIIGKSYDQIFKEFEGHVDPISVQGSGDVKYHLGATGKYESPTGADIRVELAANPSHLETVDPIVLGMVRAMQDRIEPPGSYPDAADPDPRRRRVCRPGRGRRVPGDERHQGLPRRRHHPPDHQQPDRLHHRARSTRAARCTAATWPRRCRRRSSTSTATTPRRACGWRSWPSSTARRSTRTSSSTWSATAATATTRATTRATRSR